MSVVSPAPVLVAVVEPAKFERRTGLSINEVADDRRHFDAGAKPSDKQLVVRCSPREDEEVRCDLAVGNAVLDRDRRLHEEAALCEQLARSNRLSAGQEAVSEQEDDPSAWRHPRCEVSEQGERVLANPLAHWVLAVTSQTERGRADDEVEFRLECIEKIGRMSRPPIERRLQFSTELIQGLLGTESDRLRTREVLDYPCQQEG
jgi:hypothetical protein